MQATPAAQATQAPPLQTWSVPQPDPFGSAAPLTHVDVPVEQLVVPTWHNGSGWPVQTRPAVQLTHAPALQTWFVPHVVPFAFGVPSTQTEVPVAQLVVPLWHSTSGFVEHATPAVQATHDPALQT